jgi:hypothetical protein
MADSEENIPQLVRSKQRVMDHGEVFTPPMLVEAMVDLVAGEADRIDSRFLEPACGSGNFLVPVLRRKFAAVQARYGGSSFEKRHYSLLAVMSVYGIELLPDNVKECRANLLAEFQTFLGDLADELWTAAASAVLEANIVHADALTMRTKNLSDGPIMFAEWSYLGKGKFHRRDFLFDSLTQTAAFGETDTLFADLGSHEIFTSVRDHGVLSLEDISGGLHGG